MAREPKVSHPVTSDQEIEEDRLAALKECRELANDGELTESGFEPGTYGCHEALHSVSIVLGIVEQNLLEHPSIIKDPAWYRHASKAHAALFSLYQEIGVRHLGEMPELKMATARNRHL